MGNEGSERDMYNDVCKEKFEDLKEGIKDVKKIALDTHKAICVSNGKKSILSRLDAIESDADEPKRWGPFSFNPIESRDIPRIVGAFCLAILVLEKFGVLQPLIEAWASK